MWESDGWLIIIKLGKVRRWKGRDVRREGGCEKSKYHSVSPKRVKAGPPSCQGNFRKLQRIRRLIRPVTETIFFFLFIYLESSDLYPPLCGVIFSCFAQRFICVCCVLLRNRRGRGSKCAILFLWRNPYDSHVQPFRS